MNAFQYRQRLKCHVCAGCGGWVPTGTPFCQACLNVRAAKMKTLYHERKEAGLCVECGNPARPGKSTCEACMTRRQRRKMVC